jgi:hypothetical protein
MKIKSDGKRTNVPTKETGTANNGISVARQSWRKIFAGGSCVRSRRTDTGFACRHKDSFAEGKEVTPSCAESTRSAALRCLEHLLLRMSEPVSIKGGTSLRELLDVLDIESSLFTNSDGAKTILG